MTPFTQAVIQVVRSIPCGRVVSYGDVAALAGSPKAARQVVRVLHSCSKVYDLPWHRVVNRSGGIALRDESQFHKQRHLLLSEGVIVSESGTIDLKDFGWCFNDPSIPS